MSKDCECEESCITTTMEISLKGEDWNKWDLLSPEIQEKIIKAIKPDMSTVNKRFAELVANEY